MNSRVMTVYCSKRLQEEDKDMMMGQELLMLDLRMSYLMLEESRPENLNHLTRSFRRKTHCLDRILPELEAELCPTQKLV